MKYLTILLSVFTIMSCGNSKDVNAMDTNKETMEQISGTYYVTNIGENNFSQEKLSIQFDENTNTVSGFSGCNRFTGTYKLDGDSIAFGPLATTRMHCQDADNKMEQNMLSALNSANVIEFKNQELALYNKDAVLIKASKNSDVILAQENMYRIEYTSSTRGFYNQYIFENGKLSLQKDRSSAPSTKTCSQEETNKLLKEVKTLDLEKLKTLEAPSERRFVDAAAIATLKITHQGKTYQVPEFDAGEPNKYIAPLVSVLLELTENKQKID
ncbi:META domain-containing protein [Xanthomarina sp. F2636L]|uniref:META domain-containing protein n=1 Tax=Xanthomarina sp. F2636L TaxID=2996018 RepID=UPI00225E3CE8|nr:META domain-containing protein [Xanthomarina sp. F2636L]MCX7551091.1 META domain-containing protein [Xanthomarina sp. F2636L]